MLIPILTLVLMPVLTFLGLAVQRCVFRNSAEKNDPEWELYQQRYDLSSSRRRSRASSGLVGKACGWHWMLHLLPERRVVAEDRLIFSSIILSLHADRC